MTNVSGHVTANATWSDTVNVTAATTIDAGVVVTVMPGTTINIVTNGTITINGTLDIEGTSASKVTMKAATAKANFGGISIPTGGQYTAHYLVQTGGGTHLSGGKVTIADTAMSNSIGDYLTGNGTIDVQYSSLGLEPGMADTTHCEMHFDGAGNVIKVTHTNISTSAYGLMFYGGNNADFTYNNWFSNGVDIDATPGAVSGDFSFSWFEKTKPSVVGLTMNNMSATRLTDAGPRP